MSGRRKKKKKKKNFLPPWLYDTKVHVASVLCLECMSDFWPPFHFHRPHDSSPAPPFYYCLMFLDRLRLAPKLPAYSVPMRVLACRPRVPPAGIRAEHLLGADGCVLPHRGRPLVLASRPAPPQVRETSFQGPLHLSIPSRVVALQALPVGTPLGPEFFSAFFLNFSEFSFSFSAFI